MKEIRLNLSRPHSKIDHRRGCAVVGCKRREHIYTKPFCRQCAENPRAQEALEKMTGQRVNTRGGDLINARMAAA